MDHEIRDQAGVAVMPSLKQHLRQLELRREEERRHQVSKFNTHRFLELASTGKGEAEIARELGISPEIARQALAQIPEPSAPTGRRP